MKSKVIVLVAFVFGFATLGFAGTRNRYEMPTNQLGQADTYHLPCVPKTINAATGAIAPLLALDEAGIVFWAAVTPATAGDSLIFRDSDTANSSSTAFATFEAPTVTDTRIWVFDPPMAVVNGLSINVSSQTTSAVVCVREADGDL
jgi:hypothetical protein